MREAVGVPVTARGQASAATRGSKCAGTPAPPSMPLSRLLRPSTRTQADKPLLSDDGLSGGHGGSGALLEGVGGRGTLLESMVSALGAGFDVKEQVKCGVDGQRVLCVTVGDGCTVLVFGGHGWTGILLRLDGLWCMVYGLHPGRIRRFELL